VVITDPNQAPVAGDDSASTVSGQPVTIDVLANDSDGDGDALNVASFSQAANGSVARDGDALTYTPNDGFTGTDSFTYIVSDGRGGEATGQVSVTVTGENRPPVANPDFASGPAGEEIIVDVLANDSDPDGDPLTVIKVVKLTVATASFVINGDGTVSFEIGSLCNGNNVFEYTIADPSGATSSARVEITRTDPQGEGVQNCFPTD
jgi:hypothetical protein